jgi:hypothetical protein
MRSGPDPADEDVAALLEPVNTDLPEPVEDLDDTDDEPVELPLVYFPPDPGDVEAAAAGARFLLTIEALRGYLGESGKPLADEIVGSGEAIVGSGEAIVGSGDAAELAGLLGTGDDTAGESFPGVASVVAIAKHAGAVEIRDGRLGQVRAWSGRGAVERATAVYRAIIELGALASRGSTYEIFDTVDAMIDSGTVHWLAALLVPDTETDMDEIAELVEPVVREEIEPYWPQWSDAFEQLTRNGIARLFEMLESAGVVEKTYEGTFRLTALGRHVVPDDLADAGYMLHRVDRLADAPAAAVINALDWVEGQERATVMSYWQPGRAAGERAALIADAIAADPELWLSGFAGLRLFEPDTAAPAVRGLLGGPVGGHAALYLLSRGLADRADVGQLVDAATVVDALTAVLEEPAELCALFAAAPLGPDQFATLDALWRQPSLSTATVLEALGEDLPDRALAKAARTALVKHRSWMANRG